MMEETITTTSESKITQLLAMAVKGLGLMYDPEEHLFCHRLRTTSEGLVREGISHRYTIMTLLGLLRAQSAGMRSPVDIEVAVDRLLADPAWIDNVGDLGLLLWLCAATSSERLGQFHKNFNLANALERFPDARRRLTMEISWFLTGLVFASRTENLVNVKPLANEAYRLVRMNQGQHGLFGHLSKWHSVAGVVRGRIGSFADQVYPIFAMAHFSQVFGDSEARDNALRGAKAICGLQGPLGQWWWHYDSVTGRVVEHYPVYSVHQHGMGPMALLAVQETCGGDFRAPIANGLRWINGENELHQDLEDTDAGVVWRCIQPRKSTSYAKGFRALMGTDATPGPLHTLYECRPYELGWLLYALA